MLNYFHFALVKSQGRRKFVSAFEALAERWKGKALHTGQKRDLKSKPMRKKLYWAQSIENKKFVCL